MIVRFLGVPYCDNEPPILGETREFLLVADRKDAVGMRGPLDDPILVNSAACEEVSGEIGQGSPQGIHLRRRLVGPRDDCEVIFLGPAA